MLELTWDSRVGSEKAAYLAYYGSSDADSYPSTSGDATVGDTVSVLEALDVVGLPSLHFIQQSPLKAYVKKIRNKQDKCYTIL